VLVAGFLLLHVLVWWLLPALLQHNLPLDVIEQLAWGREWQIVYFKHPPLPAWILESIVGITGRWAPAMYLAGPLASALALLAIWRLGCDLLGKRRALLAMLAQECVLYFTFFTPEFNHNVVLLPLWAAIGLAGYRAIFTNGEPGGESAAHIMRKHRTALIQSIVQWTGQRKYTVSMLVRKLILRCQELKLPAPFDTVKLHFELTAYLATLVTNHLYTGRFKRSV